LLRIGIRRIFRTLVVLQLRLFFLCPLRRHIYFLFGTAGCHFSSCESGTDICYSSLGFLSYFGALDENDKALDAGDSASLSADLGYLHVVFPSSPDRLGASKTTRAAITRSTSSITSSI